MVKKIMAVLLAAMMVIGMTIPAFADGLHLLTDTVENLLTERTDSEAGSITIQEALPDETYTIYQILEFDEEGYRVCEGWEDFLTSRTVGEDALFILTDTGYLDPESPIFELWGNYDLTDEALEWAEDNGITGVSVFLTEEFELEPEGVAVVANIGEYEEEDTCDLIFSDLSPGIYLVSTSFGTNSLEATINPWNDEKEEDKIQVVFSDPTVAGYYDEDGYYHVDLESCVSVIVDGTEMSYSEFLEYHDNGYGHDVMIYVGSRLSTDIPETGEDENGWWVLAPGDYELCVSISRHKLSSTIGHEEDVFVGDFSYYFTIDPIENEESDVGEDEEDEDDEGEDEDENLDSEGGEDENLEDEDEDEDDDEKGSSGQDENDDEDEDDESGDEEDEYDSEKETEEYDDEDDVITVYEGDQYEYDWQIEDDDDWDSEDENGNWDGGEYYEEDEDENDEADDVESSAPLKTGMEDYLPYILTLAAASLALLIYAVQKREENAQ